MKSKFVMVALMAATLSIVLVSCCDGDDIIIEQTAAVSYGSQNVKNGDVIDLTASINGTYNGKQVLYDVVYYCDDNEVGTSKDYANNYLFKYHVKDLSLGSHTLSYKGSYEDGSIKLHPSATIMIINVID